MVKRKTSYLGWAILLLQVLLVALPFIFEYLAKKKPLVMRHMYTKKIEHLVTVLDATHRNIYLAIIIVIALVFLVLLIKKTNIKVGNLIFNCLLVAILVSMLGFDMFSKKITFTYSVGILSFVWLLDIIRLLVKVRFEQRMFY